MKLSELASHWLPRAVALTIMTVLLWWWILLTPLTTLLRVSTEFALGLTLAGKGCLIAPQQDGGWIIHVPIREDSALDAALRTALNQVLSARAGTNPPRRFSLSQPRNHLALFSLGIPLFWAFTLSASCNRRVWRLLLCGTGLMWLVQTSSLTLHLLTAINRYIPWVTSDLSRSFLSLGDYLSYSVLPYAAPLLLAVALDAELRNRVFGAVAG